MPTRWTDGRALVAAGSPFGAVDHDGIRHDVAQARHLPGLGLGVHRLPGARRVTDGTCLAAARAVADMVDISDPGGAPLLPRVADLRGIGRGGRRGGTRGPRRGRGLRHADALTPPAR